MMHVLGNSSHATLMETTTRVSDDKVHKNELLWTLAILTLASSARARLCSPRGLLKPALDVLDLTSIEST